MMPSIVLVGLPGAGKSTVGAALADRLGWPFVDLDVEIAQTAGQSVAEIFQTAGEAGFRALEASATRKYADGVARVIAPGGGWITQPALPALLRPTCRIIHLVVSPAEAVRRLAAQRVDRPLLATATDPVAAVHALAEARASAYAEADIALETDGRSVAEVVDAVCMQVLAPIGVAPPVATHFNE